jgi:hypothetical protein
VNYQEITQLLAIVAVYDRRKPSEAVATVWAGDLADIELTEAITAVREHFTTNPDVWIVPGHVQAIVHRHRRRRLDHSWTAEAEALRGSDPDNVAAYLRRLRDIRDQVAAGAQDAAPALPAGRYDATPARIAANRRGAAMASAAIPKRAPQTAEGDAIRRLRELTPGPNWPDARAIERALAQSHPTEGDQQ